MPQLSNPVPVLSIPVILNLTAYYIIMGGLHALAAAKESIVFIMRLCTHIYLGNKFFLY